MRDQVDVCSVEDGGEPPRCISPSNPLAFPRPDGRTARAGPDFEIFWRIALAWAPSRGSNVHFPPATGPLGGPMDARGRGSNPVAGWRHAVAFMVAPCRQDPPRAAWIQGRSGTNWHTAADALLAAPTTSSRACWQQIYSTTLSNHPFHPPHPPYPLSSTTTHHHPRTRSPRQKKWIRATFLVASRVRVWFSFVY